MANGMLSQEEIDALLSGSMEADVVEEDGLSSAGGHSLLSDIEKDAIGEIANISMGTAATTLSQLVGKRVEITTPRVDVTTAQQVYEDYPFPNVLIDVKYKKGIEGSNMLVLSREDGAVIVDLMMGGTGKNPSTELSEMQISGISEAMNQMMGSAATSMSTMFSSVVDITPPKVIVSKISDEVTELFPISNDQEPFVRISFRITIEGIIDSILLQLIPIEVAKGMAAKLIGDMNSQMNMGVSPPPQPERPAQIQTPPSPPPSPPPEMSWQPPPTNFEKVQPTVVQPAQFAPLSSGEMATMPNNLGLIYDVPLQVSVELGKATKTIKEILELGPGSVVELDRLAGETVDMIVNGKLIAKCEVVVINETFGIRITEIVNPDERIDTFN